MMDYLRGNRTFIFALLLVILGQIQTWDLAQLVPPTYIGQLTSAIGMAVAILRFLTTTPPFDNGHGDDEEQ